MNKKSLVIVCLALVLVLSLSVFVSAGFFSNFWGKITGKVTYDSEGWTEWLDRDGPGGSGDYETKVNFVGVCDTPTNIECRVRTTKVSYDGTGQDVTATPSAGCYCLNSNNPEGCLDYEVRFLCPNMASVEPVCGDGTCDSDETCSNCPGDCGVCGTSATCESGVYSYPQDQASTSHNIFQYTPWGSDYKYAKGYCSIVHNCASYKDVTTAIDGSRVCRCDTGSFGCTGGSCTTSAGSFVTITSVTCVECDEDIDCVEGSTCQNGVCVGGIGPVCGNGILEGVEECDDGNIVSGDGCSSTCTIETVATPACIDSDVTLGYSDGKNYYEKGWYSGYGDFCSLNPGEENILLEYYCSYDASGNPIKNYTKYNCSSEGKICDRNQTSSTYGACVGDDSLTPRVAFWSGRVNQHFDIAFGVWSTDFDVTSSVGIDKLAYCKKWYGSDIVFVKEYKLETITTWMAIGNKGGPYTSVGQSYECVKSSSLTLKENGATCSSDFECKSGSCGEILANEEYTNPENVCHDNPSKCVIDSSGIEVSEGGKSCLSSKVFRTCSADNQENFWGAQTQCAPDESCFEGRGCLKHEFIFRLNDCHFPAHRYFVNDGYVGNPPELEDAMELSDSCVGVSFRINKMPPEESDLDDFVSEMEARGYYYYITAASSDFRTFAGFPTTGVESPFILDVPKLCGYLKNEHAEGLYLHEMGRYVAGAYHDKEYDWVHIEQVLACAKANKKKIIWSDFGSGGWTDIRYYIDHDNEARRIFETYGDVLVPLIADNTRTDETWRSNLPGGLDFEDIIHVSDVYCNGERGGSIQDWHWEAITGSLDVPASDIERYIGISYDEGGKYSQFEDSNWDKNEPQNHGEFYMGIERGKKHICGVSPCVSSDCDSGFSCESPKCIGSYDEKLNRYGDFYNWDANKYYTSPRCEKCADTGRKGYAVDDLAWYEHTCVENRFVWCWGARWSKGKTYLANAYRAVSCEGLSEPACNSHSECSWGSFSCVKP